MTAAVVAHPDAECASAAAAVVMGVVGEAIDVSVVKVGNSQTKQEE